MKRIGFFLAVVGLSSFPVYADNPRMLQTVTVWAVGSDSRNQGDVELDVLMELSKHGVSGERVTKLFPTGIPSSSEEIIRRMRQIGSDSVLVLRRTAAVHMDNDAQSEATFSGFLRRRAQIVTPKNQLEQGSTAPIVVPNIYGNADWEIVNGELLVYDLRTDKLMSRENTAIKSAKDLPQAKYFQFVAEKVAADLEQAKLIGPAKK